MHNMHMVARHAFKHASALVFFSPHKSRFQGEDNLPNLLPGNLAEMGRSHCYVRGSTRSAGSGSWTGTRVLDRRRLPRPTPSGGSVLAMRTSFGIQEPATSVGRDSRGNDPPEGALTRWQDTALDATRSNTRSSSTANSCSIVRALMAPTTRASFCCSRPELDTATPGDAQIESREHALPRPPPCWSRRIQSGHHGSLNATPKSLWNGFSKRGAKRRAGRLTTLLSTRAGLHGSYADGTEVPRGLLVDALKRESNLVSTQYSGSLCSVLEIELGA